MSLFRAVFSAGQNAAILSALTAVLAQLTLVFTPLLPVACDFVERRAEHFCVQPALVCDGRSIEATGQTAELSLNVDELRAGKALLHRIAAVIGQVALVAVLISRIVENDARVTAPSGGPTQLSFVLADFLAGLCALGLRLGDLALEVSIEGGIEPSEPRHVVLSSGGVVVAQQGSGARGVEAIVAELAAVLPEVLPISSAFILVLKTLSAGKRAEKQRSHHQVSVHA